MKDMSMLLIIASAFSVFGQYLGNHHNSIMESLKRKLEKCGLRENYEEDLWKESGLKEKWDDLLATQPLCTRRQVTFLCLYLMAVVVAIGVDAGITLLIPDANPDDLLKSIRLKVVILFSFVLLFLSGWLMITLRNMHQLEECFRHRVEGFLETYKAVSKVISS